MFQKPCNLLKASIAWMGGGGGGTDINQLPGGFRNWGKEQPDIGKGYQFQQDQFNQFKQNDPLLSAAQGGALDFWKQLPGMLSQFPGFQKEISGYQGQLGDLSSQLGGMIPGLQKQFGGLDQQLQNLGGQTRALGFNYNKFLGPTSALSQAYGQTIDPTLRSGGALTGDQLNAALQQGRVNAGQQGTTQDPSSLIQDYVSRKTSTDANFNQALAQSQGVLGQQQAATTGMQGLLGQQAQIAGQRGQMDATVSQLMQGILGQQGGLAQMGAGLTGQKAGLLGQQQALQTGGLNQLLGVGNAAVSQFGGLTNPILSYMQGIFGGNQQAAIAQAQANAQTNAAGSAKGGSTAGAAIGAVGSILGAVL